MNDLHEPVLEWYAHHARPLPWREPSASPWAVVVSEFMLQQTPVARVLAVYEQWMKKWPTPVDLAQATSGDVVRAWGRLGYPRRALRLHQVAAALVAEYAGQVPRSLEELRSLPGVGEYTAAAVASFAFGQRHIVLDTNVRRVFARAVGGSQFPARTVTTGERELATTLLPDQSSAATWAVAIMELGALVCTAGSPSCRSCPISELCAWRKLGYPAYDGPPRRAQTYAGTDRQCRGRLLQVLRDAPGPVTSARLDPVWDIADQRMRCLSSLVEDGLVSAVGVDTYSLS